MLHHYVYPFHQAPASSGPVWPASVRPAGPGGPGRPGSPGGPRGPGGPDGFSGPGGPSVCQSGCTGPEPPLAVPDQRHHRLTRWVQ